MILADSRQFAIRRSLLPVLSTYFYKIFTHPSTFILIVLLCTIQGGYQHINDDYYLVLVEVDR